MAWTWVCSLMFLLEIVEWRNESGKYRRSVLNCLCSVVVMKYLECGWVRRMICKEKRQLCTTVLEARRSGLNSSGFLVVDCLTRAGDYLKGHSTWRDMEEHLVARRRTLS